MGTKGEKTKHFICEAAFRLFAEKGFKDVTMKDICEKPGSAAGACTATMTAPARYFWNSSTH